jgi:hypothetical protein
MMDYVIYGVFPFNYFLRRIDQKVLGYWVLTKKFPESCHLCAAAALGIKGAILYNQKIKIRIWAGSSPCMGAKQHHLAWINFTDDFFGYFLKEFFGYGLVLHTILRFIVPTLLDIIN